MTSIMGLELVCMDVLILRKYCALNVIKPLHIFIFIPSNNFKVKSNYSTRPIEQAGGVEQHRPKD